MQITNVKIIMRVFWRRIL